MITQEQIGTIEQASSIREARNATLAVLFGTIGNVERRVQLRARVEQMGTTRQLVALAWEQMLNGEGLKLAGAVRAKKGMAWG